MLLSCFPLPVWAIGERLLLRSQPGVTVEEVTGECVQIWHFAI